MPGPVPAKPANETIGLLLVRSDKITREQLYEALREQRATGARLGDILFEKGWIGEEELAMVIAKQLDIEFIESKFLEKVPKGLVEKFPAKVAVDFRVVPVRFWKGKLTVAMDDQKTRDYIDEISYLTGQNCAPALAAPTAVRAAIKGWYDIDLPPRATPVKKSAAKTLPKAVTERMRERPVEKLEALPKQDDVFLLTEVARPAPDLVRVADEDENVPVAEDDIPELVPVDDDGDTHDNFLAPDAKDAKPAWRPKGDTKSAAKPAAPPPISKPAPAPEPAPVRAPEPEPAPGRPQQSSSSADFDIVNAAEKLFEATDPRGVGAVIVSFARHLMDRVILFDVSGPRYTVLARASAHQEEDRADEYSAAPGELILLGVIAQTKQPSYGPTPTGPMYDDFFDNVGFMKPPFILLYPLIVGGRTRAILYGGLGTMRSPEDFGDLQLLFKEAATAFEILAG